MNQNSFDKPLLSVVVITFQHEEYLRICLDSILMQDVDFNIEVIVSDDCSSDKTVGIIKEYANKFPNIFRPILRSVNVGATRNLYECFLVCRGEYIAILEGDDFWTDKKKLKAQIAFLESNQNYIACTHRYSVVNRYGHVIQDLYNGPGVPKSGNYGVNDFVRYVYFGHIGTLLFRNIFLKSKHDFSIIYKADRFIGDISLCLILTLLGDVFVSDDNMMSYRNYQIIGGTNFCSHFARKNQILERIQYLKKLEQYASEEFKIIISHEDRMPYYVWWSFLILARYPSFDNFKCLINIIHVSNDKKGIFLYVIKQLPLLPALVIQTLKKNFKKN